MTFYASLRRHWLPAVALLAGTTLNGCISGKPAGSLRAVSMHDQPTRLDVQFDQSVYRVQAEGETSFVLTSEPFEAWREDAVINGQLMHLSLLWPPKAGATPMDPTATNVAVRWVIVSHGEVGIYSGAGFATINGEPGAQRLTVTLHDATLRRVDATSRFNDLLSPAQLTGSFTTELDDARARRLRLAASQFITNRLGETKYVFVDEHKPAREQSRAGSRGVTNPKIRPEIMTR